MKYFLSTAVSVALATQLTVSQAEIQSVSGTASLYDPGGYPFMETPVTGEYDTDTQLIVIDPWIFFGSAVNSQIEVLSPGNYVFPNVLPINVGTGQLGGLITTNWAVNTIPHGVVWDVTTHPGGQHLEPTDSDGDGIPGMKMISGPFPGFTFVYELDTGAPSPSIDVEVSVVGGTVQECNETGGRNIAFNAIVDLRGGAELANVDWSVDGSYVSSGITFNSFLSLGSHTVSATATGISGITDTASISVNVRDTTKPSLNIEFIDTRSGQAVSVIDGAGVSFIEVRLNSSDICDDNPNVKGVAQSVTALMGGEVIKIQGNNNDISLPSTALEITATATDNSGNKQLDQSVLPIQ